MSDRRGSDRWGPDRWGSDRWRPVAFKTRVDEVLHGFVAQEAEQLSAIDPALGPVAGQLEAAVADGKRLRAAFCYWGWRAVGQPDERCACAGGGLDGAGACRRGGA
ncbi:Polyprenyl synthetase OS=Streptomyces antimycoticus OX=68175 GN=SANT12839_019490 PE=3 SV=1 [Streptomyces antimycoticus]